MKRIMLLAFNFLALFIYSCSEDDGGDDNSFSSGALVGTWDLVEVKLSAAVDIDGDGQSSSNLLDEEECISGFITLKEDTNYQFQQSSFTITSITNNQYYVQCSGIAQAVGAWASDGEKIAFQGSSILGTLQLDGDKIIKQEDDELPGVEAYVFQKR